MREMLEGLDPTADEVRAEQLSRWESGDRVRLEALLTARPAWEEGAPGQIGQYEVLEEVGRGGMGIVYKARHTVTGRLAAVKVIRPGDATEEERARFLTEARAISALSHPNIVQIHEVFA